MRVPCRQIYSGVIVLNVFDNYTPHAFSSCHQLYLISAQGFSSHLQGNELDFLIERMGMRGNFRNSNFLLVRFGPIRASISSPMT